MANLQRKTIWTNQTENEHFRIYFHQFFSLKREIENRWINKYQHSETKAFKQ